jgi:hypothetical protein
MDFFDGFAWALPAAFADALEKCRFERGDVLYDHPDAYARDWAGARAVARRVIQVRLPQQADSGKVDKDAASVFADNWRRSAEIDLIETKDLSTRAIETTQGRLYTFLWRDDDAALDLDTPEPTLPLMAGDLRTRLEVAAAGVAARVRADGPAGLFVFPFDHASSRLREKDLAVRGALAEVSGSRELEFPVEADDERGPLPTLRWKAYLLPDLDEGAVTDLLKPALYNPQGNSEGRADRFSLARHGRFLSLAG